MHQQRMSFRQARVAAYTLAAVLIAGATVACNELTHLEQQNPSQLDATTLYIPTNAPLVVSGAISDFECAYSRYVVGSGLLADELIAAIQSADSYSYERRTIPSNGPYGTGTCASGQFPAIYTTLSLARATTDTALAKLEGWTDQQVPNRSKLMAQAATYAGYSLVLLGEGMCGAALNLGPQLTPAQLFAEAKLRFDKAIPLATAANDQTTLNLAYLGRARALLDAGDLAGAGADAARIPAAFNVGTSPDAVNARRQNMVFVHTSQSSWSSIDPSFRDIRNDTASDIRVLTRSTGKNGTAPGVPIWIALKDSLVTLPISLARYAEAQLILAEVRTAANDLTGAQTAINNARNTHVPGPNLAPLPQYSATGQTQAQVRAQIIEERRREFFLEGHRLGDIRRYGVPLSPATGSDYVTGGGKYGDQSCFPLPDVERINNPNIGA